MRVWPGTVKQISVKWVKPEREWTTKLTAKLTKEVIYYLNQISPFNTEHGLFTFTSPEDQGHQTEGSILI